MRGVLSERSAVPPIVFFVDSANRADAERFLRTGVATGVTTNPTILRRTGARASDIPLIHAWATDAGAREVCFQTWGSSAEEWYANAMRIREWAPDATVKVPCTEAGAGVIRRLHAQDVPVLMTAVYAAKQALVGSALGVRYLAPYFDRLRRTGRDAVAEFARMTTVIPQDGSGPLVMAASLKSANDVLTLAEVGVRVFTAAPEVLADVFDQALTEQAVEAFERDMLDVL